MKIYRLCALAFIFVVIPISVFAQKADMVVFGKIYTANNNDDVVEAMAIKDGKYLFVGDRKKARKYIGQQTALVEYDCHQLITPSFTDGHAHRFFMEPVCDEHPQDMITFDDTKESILRKVEQYLSEHPNIKYLHAQGFNNALCENPITRDILDNISTQLPICLIDASGHRGFFNTAALKRAFSPLQMYSFDVEEPMPTNFQMAGGDIFCFDKGHPMAGTVNGYLTEEIMHYVVRHIISPNTDVDAFCNRILQIRDIMHSMGYTNYVDAITNSYTTDIPWQALKILDDKGELQMNVISNYDIFTWDKQLTKTLDEVADWKMRFGTRHFNPTNIQFFIDGTPQAATALISKPYFNLKDKSHDYCGLQLWSDEALLNLVVEANNRGIICHPHTMGDLAVHKVINTYIKAAEITHKKLRNNVTHVRGIGKEDIRLAADLGIAVVGGTILHAPYFNKASEWQKFTDRDIAHNGYPLKSIVEGGARLCNHTETFGVDNTLTSGYHVLSVSVAGILKPGETPYNPSELLTPLQALRTITINGAWQMGLEKERGSIEVGKYADFTVADGDILTCDRDKISAIQILATYFEGKRVY